MVEWKGCSNRNAEQHGGEVLLSWLLFSNNRLNERRGVNHRARSSEMLLESLVLRKDRQLRHDTSSASKANWVGPQYLIGEGSLSCAERRAYLIR